MLRHLFVAVRCEGVKIRKPITNVEMKGLMTETYITPNNTYGGEGANN